MPQLRVIARLLRSLLAVLLAVLLVVLLAVYCIYFNVSPSEYCVRIKGVHGTYTAIELYSDIQRFENSNLKIQLQRFLFAVSLYCTVTAIRKIDLKNTAIAYSDSKNLISKYSDSVQRFKKPYFKIQRFRYSYSSGSDLHGPLFSTRISSLN